MPATALQQVETAPHLEPQSPRLASTTRELRVERLQTFDGTARCTRTLGPSSDATSERARKMPRREQLRNHGDLYTPVISSLLRGAWRGDQPCERVANRFLPETPTVRDVGAAIGNRGTSQRSGATEATRIVKKKATRSRRYAHLIVLCHGPRRMVERVHVRLVSGDGIEPPTRGFSIPEPRGAMARKQEGTGRRLKAV